MKRRDRLKLSIGLLALTVGLFGMSGTQSTHESEARRGLSSVSSQSSQSGSELGRVTSDQALYDRVRQMDLRKAPQPSFEDDLAKLSSQESRHRERLPSLAGHPRLKSVIQRMSAGPYQRRS